MKHLLLTMAVLLAASGCNQQPLANSNQTAEQAPAPTPEFEANTVLVVFQPGVTAEQMQKVADKLNGSIEPYQEGKTAYKITLHTQTTDSANVTNAINLLRAYPEVKSAEPNYIITIPDCSKGPC